jgi:hypothetical protein
MNKMVHREASSLLYAQNRFDFSMCTSAGIVSFLDQIGRNNAGYIRHICIDFPVICDFGDTLKDDSARILAKIQSDCTNLSTLTTSLSSTSTMVLKLDALDSPKIVGETLAAIDARFKAIQTLEEIIVEVEEDCLSGDIRRKVESYGWTINIIEQVEESDPGRFFSDDDDYTYNYGYDYDYYDDYDDDYNSDEMFDDDYWRRAGD